MAPELAVPNIERLIDDKQSDELAVGHVEDRLPGLRVSVPSLGVRQGPELVEAAQVGAGKTEWLAFIEVPAQPDVAV